MKPSKNFFTLIEKHEGFRNKPYLCPAGKPTIGFGSTFYPKGNLVQMDDANITKEQAREIAKVTCQQFALQVSNLIRSKLNQNQFDAVLSFAYNVGVKNLSNSTLLKKINHNPNDPLIRNEFNKWVYAGGEKLNGLIQRRKEEADLYFS